MKTLHVKPLKDGRRHVLIELLKGEDIPVAAIKPNAFYRLSDPMDDQIIAGYILHSPQRVAWCSFSQKWVES